MTKKSIDLNRD